MKKLLVMASALALLAGCGDSGPPKTFTNSIGMKFVLIPAGNFMMGSPPDDPKRNKDEVPRHQVVFSRPFYMQTTEVTQAQHRTIMGGNPSHFKGCDRCPVEKVSWFDAQEFIRRLNAREKTNKYRLPTEAEWEYACRAGTRTAYYFGNDPGSLGAYAWYRRNSGGQTRPVARKRPNRWGLYDMHGNVWEWCSDWYHKYYYRTSPARDPKGPSSGRSRLVRGSCWANDQSSIMRSAFRNRMDPGNRSNDLGFRVLKLF
jgi:formylglycine-generating enzyme required for sulfatase activity